MRVYVAVGCGGIIGTSLRYIISLLFHSENLTSFPWATLIVNITGAFFLTFILFHPTIAMKLNPTVATALTTGVIGSYTTFSTITVEVALLAERDIFFMISYLLLTIFGGLFSSFIGFKTARYFSKGGVKS